MMSRSTVPGSTAARSNGSTGPGRVRRRLFAAAIGFVALLAGSTAAVAADDDPAVGFQETSVGFSIVRASEGALVELAAVDVDAALIGQACTLTASFYNQRSVNPGNDVIVATGGTQMTLTDIEALADTTTTGSASVIAGDVVTFTLVMGPKQVYSGQLHMSLECQPPTTSTTAPSTTTSSTTTTTVPPAGADVVTTTTAAATTTSSAPIESAVLPAQAAAPVQGQPTFTG
jgi:hypothetical protein